MGGLRWVGALCTPSQVCPDPGFVDIIVRAMRPLFCSPGETVIGEGNQGNEMFFLIKGKVEVLRQDHTANCEIRVGEVREGE